MSLGNPESANFHKALAFFRVPRWARRHGCVDGRENSQEAWNFLPTIPRPIVRR